MSAEIAPDPDLGVSSNKGHLPFIASVGEMSELGDCGIGEASEFRRDSVARYATPNPFESREPAGETAERPSVCGFFRSLMAAFLSCRVRQILTRGESIDHQIRRGLARFLRPLLEAIKTASRF